MHTLPNIPGAPTHLGVGSAGRIQPSWRAVPSQELPAVENDESSRLGSATRRRHLKVSALQVISIVLACFIVVCLGPFTVSPLVTLNPSVDKEDYVATASSHDGHITALDMQTVATLHRNKNALPDAYNTSMIARDRNEAAVEKAWAPDALKENLDGDGSLRVETPSVAAETGQIPREGHMGNEPERKPIGADLHPNWALNAQEVDSSTESKTHAATSAPTISYSHGGHCKASMPRVTLVSAASSTHFSSAVTWLLAADAHERCARIVMYDLGFSPSQLQILKEYAENFPLGNIHIEEFDLGKYPPHAALSARTYAWKPLLIQEVIHKHGGLVIWNDAGDVINGRLDKLYNVTQMYGFYSAIAKGTIEDWTYPTTLERFGIDESLLAKPELSAAILAIDTTNKTVMSRVMQPWFDCAMEKECIAPTGSSRKNHRQDQSIITCLALKEGVSPDSWGKRLDPRPSEEAEIILFNGRFPLKGKLEGKERLISIHIDTVGGVGGWPTDMDDDTAVEKTAIERLKQRLDGEICLKFVFKYQMHRRCIPVEEAPKEFYEPISHRYEWCGDKSTCTKEEAKLQWRRRILRNRHQHPYR